MGHHHCQQNVKGKTSGKLFQSWLQTCLSQEGLFPHTFVTGSWDLFSVTNKIHICNRIFSQLRHSQQMINYLWLHTIRFSSEEVYSHLKRNHPCSFKADSTGCKHPGCVYRHRLSQNRIRIISIMQHQPLPNGRTRYLK